MFQFPFGNFQQLNLDWFLAKFNEYVDAWYAFKDDVEGAISDVFSARDTAVNAKNDAVSAKNDAVTAKNAADADALKAEGFAVGEQNGTPVASGSPYYNVNAKHYSIEAGTNRYLSEAYAKGTMGGTPVASGDAGYEDNAKYYKDLAHNDYDYIHSHLTDADASALEAEGYAVGEQGGTPVASGSPYYENNAKYYAGEAQQDKDDADTFKDAANAAALRSEGFSVGEQNGTPVNVGSPYYQNNAKYYAQIAAVSPYFKQVIPNKIIPLKYFSEAVENLSTLYGIIPSVLGNILYLSDYTNWSLSSKTIQMLYPVQEASSFAAISTKSYIKIPAGNYRLSVVLIEGSIEKVDGGATRIGYAALFDDSANLFKTVNIPLNWNKFDAIESNFTLSEETNVDICFQLSGWADCHVNFKDVAIEILIESTTNDILNRNINAIENDNREEPQPESEER